MSSGERKQLVWSIKKKLHQLTGSEAHLIATSLGDVEGLDSSQLTQNDEESCVEYLTTYLTCPTILGREDQGLPLLKRLECFIDSTMTNRGHTTVSFEAEASTSEQAISPVQPQDGYDPQGRNPTPSCASQSRNQQATSASVPPATGDPLLPTQRCSPQYSVPCSGNIPSHTGESMIAMKDLPLLSRREFKVHGGMISDTTSEISYNSICKQIDEGLRENHTPNEVIRGVLRAIKPGNFRDMLTIKDDLTVSELKSFLQSHLGEKSSTALFQDLMCAKQFENETPQQFLYRMIGLKQKILFSLRQPD
ncbi:uncharacterized protein LOC116729656 [Xiphophorus hellerii]|uniref:uncharacterized protein LOC116729656 n=1 Tax=Xiphophorus hellerii TaxID=8084 RepID=UPI0013B3F1BF|nr:uncharacterized protein LOC116729656 [Xiphophorus hellerii]